MAVRCSLTVDRAAKIERFDDSLGRELEEMANQLGDLRIRNRSGAKGVGHYGNRLGNADGVSELDFHFGGQAGGYNVLCDVACHVASGAVNLGGVFSGESAAAVTAVAAVGVHDNLAAGQTCVTHGTAGYEAAGGIDVVLGLLVDHGPGKDRTDDFGHHRFFEFAV